MTGSTFTVRRHSDPSGISGTGVIAEGWESSDGKTVVLLWLTDTPSLNIYRDIRDVEAIHGHGGSSEIVFDSPTQYTPSPPLPFPTNDVHDPEDDR